MKNLTPFSKFLMIFVVMAGLFFGYRYVSKNGMLDKLAPTGKQAQNISPDVFKSEKATKLDRPIRVGVNTWGGWAGGLAWNKSFKANTESNFYQDSNIQVEFVLMDDSAAGRESWKADKLDFWWTTVDSFPVDVVGLKGLQPKLVLQSDWSRGGDAIVVKPGIGSVAQLKGKSVAVAEGSPSMTFLLWMLSAGELNSSDIKIVKTSDGIESAKYFKADKVDAAVVWSPDDEDCLGAIPGSKVLMSTKQASNIIADALYTKKSFIERYPAETKAFVEGWLKGNADLNSSATSRKAAAKVLAVGFNVPEDFAVKAISNARLATYGDNMNFFGLNRNYSGVTGQNLYEKMTEIYQRIGIAGENLPDWRQIVDTSVLQSIELAGAENAAEGQATFKKISENEGRDLAAVSTKRLTINFPSGSATLDPNAKNILRMGFVDLAKSFASSRIRIEGNTDSVGGNEVNVSLSKRRANAVAQYFVETYHFDPRRFVVIGNGKNKPIASNDTEDGRAQNRRTDFELLSN